MGETKFKIEGSQRKRHCLGRSLEVYFCRFLFYPYLLVSDVGSLWSQGLEGTSVSIGCGWALFMVARIRRNFCQYRMWTRMYSSTCICWAPMWDHSGRKDWKELLSVYDALGETGIEGESEEKALPGKVAGGPPARMCSSYLLGSDVGPFGFKDAKKLLSV